jgi:peptidoglycan-N-acetylglucosamine deacetylase
MSRRLTLSFDNGPTPGITDQVLDVLGEHGARATFFVVGRDLQQPGARALAERAASEGHWIGNHTMTHEVQFGDTDDPERPTREILEAQAVIDGLSHPDHLFRPYGGGGVLSRRVLTKGAVRTLEQGDYTCVLWNCVPRDWEDPDAWMQRTLDAVDSQPWTLVVLHDQDTGAMRHLSSFLAEVVARGIELRQDFPDECVPIRRGRQVGPLDHLLDS